MSYSLEHHSHFRIRYRSFTFSKKFNGTAKSLPSYRTTAELFMPKPTILTSFPDISLTPKTFFTFPVICYNSYSFLKFAANGRECRTCSFLALSHQIFTRSLAAVTHILSPTTAAPRSRSLAPNVRAAWRSGSIRQTLRGAQNCEVSQNFHAGYGCHCAKPPVGCQCILSACKSFHLSICLRYIIFLFGIS